MHPALLPIVFGVPHLQAARVGSPPRVDGVLDDAVWQAAPASDAFVQKYPDEGHPPSERTVVRVIYDDRDVYVGIRCEQIGVPVVSRLTRRDRAVEADRVTVDVDTRRDGKTAFHFEVNAAGVLVDGLRFEDTELALEWDENWEARTARDAAGWSVEIRLPLRVLRFTPRPSQTFGLQVRRYVSKRQEIDEWSFVPRDAAGEVSRYGELGPLEWLASPRGLELAPFVLGKVTDGEPGGSAGLDGKWHLGRDLTLAFAANPDFAQVEADEATLNLGTTELFFPEKRPFFLEGTDVFATPIAILYTRRIGHGADAPVRGAAKLVGRIGDTTVGALSAMTDGVEAETEPGEPVEPPSLYEALRMRQELGERGHVGIAGTAVVRLEDRDDATMDAFHDAYVGGVDGRWRSPSSTYSLAAQVVGSLIEHGPPRMLRDGTVVEAGDRDLAVSARAAKDGGALRGELQYVGIGRDFEPNDAGFLERQNLHDFWGVLEARDTEAGRFFVEHAGRLEVFHRYNLDGLKLAEGYQVNHRGTTRGFFSYFVEAHWRRGHFDDREVGDGTALERAGLLGLEVELETDPRAAVTAELSSTWQLIANGRRAAVELPVTFKLWPQLDLELTPAAEYTDGEPRFVAADPTTGALLFGRQRAQTLGATLRAAWTFTPRVTLQSYAQVFYADVAYRDFTMPAAATRVIHLDDLAPAAPPAEDPDFREVLVNANVVLRWEYRLGSTLFLVYTRAQQGERLRAPAVDVFLLKLSYWWG